MIERQNKQLSCEALESRVLLAGNVQVSVDDGDLFVLGDSRANEVWIASSRSGDGGTYQIWGKHTRINGAQHGHRTPLEVTGVTGGIQINLRGGPDEVYLYELRTAGDVNVRDPAGHDELYIEGAQIGGNLLARLGKGGDDAYVRGLEVAGQSKIAGGKGNDYLGTVGEYSNYGPADDLDAVARGFEDFGVVDAQPNVMELKLNQAIVDLGRDRVQIHAIDQIMESIFVSNLVPLPGPTDQDPNQPDPQDDADFREHLERMDRAIAALDQHVRSRPRGTDETKTAAADARNFLQLMQEAMQVVAGQTAFCDPNQPEVRGIGCQFLNADDEGGTVVDQVLGNITAARQVRSPFFLLSGDGRLEEQVILTDSLADGECAAIVKEVQGIKVVVTPRQIPVWVEPWFSRARIVGFRTVWAWEFVPAEFIKTISVCNDAGDITTTADTQVVMERELLHFWKFLKKEITAVA